MTQDVVNIRDVISRFHLGDTPEVEALRAALREIGEWGNLEESVAKTYDRDHGPGSYANLINGSTS